MNFKNFSIIAVILFGILFLPFVSSARIGVGVGTGKIQLDESLKPGGIYELPSLPVLNTGDETADYEVTVEFHENIPQIWPDRAWFNFEPQTFRLEPGKIQTVKVNLTIPTKTVPGDYFAYLEAHPVKKAQAGGVTSIGIAAAAKLYFTVAPANIFQGIYYRISSFLTHYSPWTWIVLGVLILIALAIVFKKKFKFQVSFSKKD